ncbi:MAG: LysR family transcriptional regulator [Pseudobdellovibrionaceae bacterium]
MINVQYLQTFRVLIEKKSFIATANELNMTQPGVSQHLKHLEEYFKVELIIRKGKFFEITEAGRKLKDYSEKLFAEHEIFKSEIGTDDPFQGICKISVTGGFGFLLYSFLISLNKKYPKLIIDCTVAPNSTIQQGVSAETFRLGFISVPPSSSNLNKVEIDDDELVLAAPKKKIKSYSDLISLGFIAHPDGYNYANQLLSENFPDQFTTINDIKHSGFINQANRILDPVAAGLGFSIVSKYTFDAYADKKNLQLVKLKKRLVFPVYMISKKNSQLPKRYDLLIKELHSYLKQNRSRDDLAL